MKHLTLTYVFHVGTIKEGLKMVAKSRKVEKTRADVKRSWRDEGGNKRDISGERK